MEPLRGKRSFEAETPPYELKTFPAPPSLRTSRPYDLWNRDVRRRWLWKIRNLSSNFWLWEWLACTLSLVLVGITIYQLKKIDNKDVYYWTWRWEPNAVLAFSITIMKAAIMVPVASSIGQLKWRWFRNSRQLDGIEYFDEASRGVIGSFKLLLVQRFWQLASIGAIITMSSLAVDTLAQNTVKIRHIPYVSYNSSFYIHGTDMYNFTDVYKRRERPLPPRWILANLNYAITTWDNLTTFQNNYWTCPPKARCEYPAFQSLAVDVQCIPRGVEKNGSVVHHPSTEATNLQLDLAEGLINSTISLEYPTTDEFVNLGPLIFRWLLLVNADTQTHVPLAMECAFYWTVHSYRAIVRNGTLNENITATWTNTTDRDTTPHDIVIKPPNCLRENSTIIESPQLTPDNCSNYVLADSHASLQTYLTDEQGGFVGSATNATKSGDTELYFNTPNLIIRTMLGYFYIGSIQTLSSKDLAGNVTNYAQRLADTLTYCVRTAPRQFDPHNASDPGIYGQTWANVAWYPDDLYHISWGYLVLPIAFVLCGALFFAATVVLTWRDTKWKSSMLAAMFHGLSPADLNAMGNVDSYADIREVGQNVQARLVSTELGKKLMSREAIMAMD